MLLDGKAATVAFESFDPSDRSAEAGLDLLSQQSLAETDEAAKAAADHLLALAGEREEETFVVRGPPPRRASALGFAFINRRSSFLSSHGGGGGGGVASPLRSPRPSAGPSVFERCAEEPLSQKRVPPAPPRRSALSAFSSAFDFGGSSQRRRSGVDLGIELSAPPLSPAATSNPLKPVQATRLSHTPTSAQAIMDNMAATSQGGLGASLDRRLPDAAAAEEGAAP
jgi:hypothetical protein